MKHTISVVIISRDNSAEVSHTLSSIHENVMELKSLNMGQYFRGVVVIDYASHPTEAEDLEKRLQKEKSAQWCDLVYERRVIPLTPVFAFERGVQLVSKFKTAERGNEPVMDWVFILKPGVNLEKGFMRKFLLMPPMTEESSDSHKKLVRSLFGEFIVPFNQTQTGIKDQSLGYVRKLFHRYSIKQFLGVKVHPEFLIFDRSKVKLLGLDWYAKYPKFTIKDVISDAIRGRGWKTLLRPDLTYSEFRPDVLVETISS